MVPGSILSLAPEATRLPERDPHCDCVLERINSIHGATVIASIAVPLASLLDGVYSVLGPHYFEELPYTRFYA